MAYNPIVDVQISINATPLTQAGFGTPLFITGHRVISERVLEISSADELIDLGFGTDSPAYIAAGQVFGQTPRVPSMKIGRRDMNAEIVPENPTDDDTTIYQFGITATINGVDFTTNVSAQVADVGGVETEEAAVDALIVAFAAIPEFQGVLTASKTGSSTSARLVISSDTSGDAAVYFTISEILNGNIVSYNYTAYETPSDTITAIRQIDKDWYFVAVDTRSNDQYILDMAEELKDDECIFFYGSADVSNLSAYQLGNQDLFARLKDSNYDRVVTFFHQDAPNFVELAYIGANAPFDAGSVTWANVQIRNVGASQDPSRGRALTTTQKSNLMNKNANYIEYDAGIPFTRTGTTAGGEWIDVIRGVDWQTADLATSLRALLVNQKGGKIPYTDQGTAQVREVISSSLQRGVNRQFLSDYEVYVPLVRDISQLDRLARVLTGVTFTGYLAGAIHEIQVRGVVTV